MIDWTDPPPVFNLLTDAERVSRTAQFAGPLGLAAFVIAIPFILWIGRRWPRTALNLCSIVWLLATLRVPMVLILLGGVAAALAWVLVLGGLRRRGVIGQRGMIALVWIGLHTLIFPLWWRSTWSPWPPSPMQVMHTVGFAYFLLRFIGWGVELAKNPLLPMRLVDSITWLLYPPIMRLGPLVSREVFFERLAEWNPRTSTAFLAGCQRAGLCAIGVATMFVVSQLLPRSPKGGPTFLEAPQNFTTLALVLVIYLAPIQIYLVLWTYNELAAAIACWIGIRIDNNFNWLPLATSVRDFWRRWHITVGGWLRRYIYIPLGGNRSPAWVTYFAVFLYCGAWHGPCVSFLVWGASQATALVMQKYWDRWWGIDESARTPRPAWSVATGWVLTQHYQLLTIFMFFDFDHAGVRVFSELIRRWWGM